MADHLAAIEADGRSFRPIPSSKAFYLVAQHERSTIIAVGGGSQPKEVVELEIVVKNPLVGDGLWPSARISVVGGEVVRLDMRPCSVRSPLAARVLADFADAVAEWSSRMKDATRP